MNQKFRFNRVLLKISGEALKGAQDHGYDAEAVRKVVRQVKKIMDQGATVMNALCLRDFFTAAGIPAVVQSAIKMEPIASGINRDAAVKALESGQLVIFAGGTGSPFFTTDTTAVLRALETDCDAVLKATKVDGVYTADPVKDPSAQRFAELSFDEALARQLKVMDSTAFSMCRDNDLPIIVFNFGEEGSFERILAGTPAAGT